MAFCNLCFETIWLERRLLVRACRQKWKQFTIQRKSSKSDMCERWRLCERKL